MSGCNSEEIPGRRKPLQYLQRNWSSSPICQKGSERKAYLSVLKPILIGWDGGNQPISGYQRDARIVSWFTFSSANQVSFLHKLRMLVSPFDNCGVEPPAPATDLHNGRL
jgi:hypothetical protein